MNEVKLKELFNICMKLRFNFKFIPDFEGDGYSVFVNGKCYYDAEVAIREWT